MSGIGASVRLDGGAAQHGEIAAIVAGLFTRGPDGSSVMVDGPAALGHALLATTPEAATEPMPLRHGPTGCLISADARLDNRDDLIVSLEIHRAARMIGDGELILEAYLKWGLDCPCRLLGDFAFVIWDPRHQRVFAARDKVGMRQLIYHHRPGRLFACATDPNALLAHDAIPHRINEARVADFIEQFEAIDHVSTFYADLFRLPPAHALTVENGELRTWRYWTLTPPQPLRLSSDAEYEEAFLDIFTKAVSARLRSPDPVGAMLSGGMDSGSVTAIAARLLHRSGAPPLMTFSAVDDDPACIESACIRDSIAAIRHTAPHIISLGDAETFRDEVAPLVRDSADPFDSIMVMHRAIYLAAQRRGIKVMLDGGGGDTTLATGDVVAFHLARGRPDKALAEARAQARFWEKEDTALRDVAVAMRRMLTPVWIRNRRQQAWRKAEARREAEASLVGPALAARVNLDERRRSNAVNTHWESGCAPYERSRNVLHAYTIVGRERYDRVASTFGIEPRDPFLDVRLLEFSLSLPIEQLHGDGWAKLILRRAMAGMLPDTVRWKRGRNHVGWRFTQVCINEGLHRDPDDTLASLSPYTDGAPGRSRFLLQCDSEGVVSETDLSYLANWILRN